MNLKYNTRDEIFEEIKKIVVEVTLTSGDELTRETRINDDLRLAGLDVEDITVPFFKKFNVHLGDFEFERYFIPEGVDMLGIEYIKCKITGKEYPQNLKDVTLGDLENVVVLGVWQDSIIPIREPEPLSFLLNTYCARYSFRLLF